MNTNLIPSGYSPSGNRSNNEYRSNNECSNNEYCASSKVPVHQGRELSVHRAAPKKLSCSTAQHTSPLPPAIDDKVLTGRSATTVVQPEHNGFAAPAAGIPSASEWQQLDASQRSRLALCLLDQLASVDFATTCKVLNFLLEEYQQAVDAGRLQVNSEQALQSASLALAKLGMIADDSGQLCGQHDQGLRFLLGDRGQLFLKTLAQAGLTRSQSALLLACYVNTPLLIDIMARCEDYWADQLSGPEMTTGQLMAHWHCPGTDESGHSLCRSSQGNPANTTGISGWLTSMVAWAVLPTEVSGNAASTIAPPTGPCCRKGDPGQTGQKGEDGDPGDVGEIGTPGKNKLRGPKGDSGSCNSGTEERPACPEGEAGPQGPRGAPGQQGLKGNMGLPSAKGDMGLPGPRGDSGLPGPAGPPGLPGKVPSCGFRHCTDSLLSGAIGGAGVVALAGAIYGGYKLYQWSSCRAPAAGKAKRDIARPTTRPSVDIAAEEPREMSGGMKVRQRIEQFEKGII
ncbi:collagen-like protein [Endozoicomonas sp. ONNA2]|uniref:collagen-like protein n=1 Tax=Endozoicomonas sp. ONNA2 TaxID=2828741 RepID=UPI002147B629|nr:collagen-like protein [Endozoicomonas sp. ONNA2]